MSQDIRDYELIQVDNRLGDVPEEAHRMGVTATVGPTGRDWPIHGNARGVQITLDTRNGVAYARVSEPQIRDLIHILSSRINPDAKVEATGWETDRLNILPDGSVRELR